MTPPTPPRSRRSPPARQRGAPAASRTASPTRLRSAPAAPRIASDPPGGSDAGTPPRIRRRADPRPSGDQLIADGQTVPVTNLGKILYPESGFTKGEVIAYYRAIAPLMLPHLAGKPVSLQRMPDGVGVFAFFEKRAPAKRPPWVATARVTSSRHGHLEYVVVDNLATLLWLANRAALELHTYLFRATDERRPLSVVFDLDPGAPAGLRECLPLALELRDILHGLGLESFAKTSGGKGVHIVAPLDGRSDFTASKAFALAVARLLEKRHPERVTTIMAKAERLGKIFIDWSQNDHGKTTISVYSLRARARPMVSSPVTWEEIERAVRLKRPERLVFDAPALLARVANLGDLFAPVLTRRQGLPRLPG